ncbi:MAG: DUF2628 domain-containing protein [Alphaproteobacteria bacterium]
MEIFTVHRRLEGSAGDSAYDRAPRNRAGRVLAYLLRDEFDGPVLVKEGFAWWAALFGPFWALHHRLWGYGFLLIAAEGALAVIVAGLADPVVDAALGLALAAFIGFSANDARRAALAARGAPAVAIVAARDRDGAFQRYVDRHGAQAAP